MRSSEIEQLLKKLDGDVAGVLKFRDTERVVVEL